MKLKRIRIENYKVFRELDLFVDGRSTVLFGINGVGKSTVLSAVNYIFRVFLNQLNPAQSRAFEKFQDEMIHAGSEDLKIEAIIELKENFLLSRNYKKTVKNSRVSEATYPRVNYAVFRDAFESAYLSSNETGMPIFVHYGTNRTVLDFPDRIRTRHQFDKLSAIEHAMDLQLDFRTFFEWYREREADEVLKIKESSDYAYKDPALSCVRKAIESMIGNVNDLQIKRNPVRMVVDKAGKEIRVDLLSDGEKCTLALLGDLARRLILANPNSSNPLEGFGIVQIDEIELHMHPSWQRRILHVLKKVFPNIQFIITTHSPQVLGEAGSDYVIFSLGVDDLGNGYAMRNINRMDGYDSNTILEEFMNTSSESNVKKTLVKEINEAIRTGKLLVAEGKLEELKELAGEEDVDYILSTGDYLRRKAVDSH